MQMNTTLAEVVKIFRGNDGDATRALYRKLEERGTDGAIAIDLLRICKTSARAKRYRRHSRAAAYDTKNWSMSNLCARLHGLGDRLADARVISWGWGEDSRQAFHKFVLYVELSTGQVSFHSAQRFAGPDFAGAWDGKRLLQADRIVRWVAGVMEGRPIDAKEGSAIAPTRWLCDGDRHLVCLPYTVDGLHDMAEALEIKPCWFHGGTWPHYDIPKGRHNEIMTDPRVQVVATRELLKRIKEDAGRQLAQDPAPNLAATAQAVLL